jgi:DNA-binding transcriptional ArsR family regulator
MSALDLSGRPLAATARDQELFVDREDELERAQAAIRRHSNVLVVGDRGIGKTSFLHRLEQQAPDDVDPIYIDASLADDLPGLLDLIAANVRGHTSIRRPSAVRPFGRPLGETGAALAMLDELKSYAYEPGRAVVLLLDEIQSGTVAQSLFGRLRDELWSLPFVWVVAADAARRAAYLRPPADAFFGTVVELGPLDPRLMLKRRFADLPRAHAEALARLSDGSPRRLIELVRQVLVENRHPRDLVADEERIASILDRFGPSARMLVDTMRSRGSVSASDEELLERLGWTRSRATQLLKQLEEAGVVTSETEKGGRKKLYQLSGSNGR